MKPPPLYFEFTRHSLRLGAGADGAEFPLARQPDGRLTAASRDTLQTALTQFLRNRGWPARSLALVGIEARGVSLRCLALPALAGDGLAALVRLQIESDLPLPPGELAWGFSRLGAPERQPDGSLRQALLVAAVKKEIIEDYTALFTAAGLNPVFTVAALARAALCPHPPAAYAVLELGADHAELIGFDHPTRAFVRVLPSGTRALAQSGEAAVDALVKLIRRHGPVSKLYVIGDKDNTAPLLRRLGRDMVCEPLVLAPGDGRSAAILGLKQLAAEPGGVPLTLQFAPADEPQKSTTPILSVWGMRAVWLLLAVLLFPCLEALFLSAPLAEKVAAFQARAGLLETNVNHDLSFLQFLKLNQPPYLESVYVIAQAAPAGIHLESLTLNRRGEMALRGALRNGDQVAEFRAKLMASGFFASTTVEEQSPTPDHQRVNIRMTAQWKPPGQLQALAIGPTPAERGETNAGAAAVSSTHQPAPKVGPASSHATNEPAAGKASASNLSSNLNKGGTN
jgi:hypothetical protein